jgi:very-short-patch-repair endonuclease
VDELLDPWLTGPLDDPEQPPALRETINVQREHAQAENDGPDEHPRPSQVTIDEQPDLRERYEYWRARWQAWADRELIDRPVRSLYGELFSAYVTATGHPEELELVVGVGCLVWTPSGHPAVKRHLLTAPVAIHFDDDTGRLTVARVESVDAMSVELDMLDPGLVTNPQYVNDVRAEARLLEAHPLHRDEVGSLVRRLVHTLDADGEYRAEDTAPASAPQAVATFAPAVILRKRSQQGLVEIFQTIGSQIAEAGEIPDGVLPLIDPDHRPQVQSDGAEGALVTVDDDPFLPLPVNDVQLRIIRQVDTNAQTVVQGPPGTGKTHTAAALLSHLLAQGKRVLVTAHTDRALKEVRDKLPEAIKPLAVAVVGTSREDMSDLKLAVERIAATAAEHDPEEAQATIRECHAAVDQLRRGRARLHYRLVNARGREVREHEHAGYRGTLAAIAEEHQTQAERFAWLDEYTDVSSGSTAPLDNREMAEWRGYLLNTDLAADGPESRERLADLSTIPEPHLFADLVAVEEMAATKDAHHETLKGHAAFDAVSRLDPVVRDQVRHRLHELCEAADQLARRHEAWMNDALSDVRSGRTQLWHARARQVFDLIQRSGPVVEWLGPLNVVNVAGDDVGRLIALAKTLHGHLRAGGKIKTTPNGAPKIGSLAPRAVKHAQPLFDQVRVGGLPPTALAQLDTFLAWTEAESTLAALDRAWPDTVHIPAEDTLHERLQWHITELEQLNRVLRLGAALVQEEQRLAGLGLPRPDWNDLDAVHTYARLVDVAATVDARMAATAPLQQVEQTLVDTARWPDAGQSVQQLLLAVRQRDHPGYAAAHLRLERLLQVRRADTRRDELAARLSAGAPTLRVTIEETAAAPEWNDRLARFTEAWAWASTGAWVRERETEDVNALQAEITQTEERIRRQVEILSATRAWSHAVSPDRLTGQARANLEQYAYLVRRLGKGTGKYAVQRKAEIRQAMDRCRPAIPVWIMPVYRIAEQLQIQPDIFDVVVVDEASQAGLEATFLQYLAPKIVVIGDDKQVSPTAVGVNQQQLRDLAGQYLADDPYRASWQDPQRSLFDEAKMRYSGTLTLTEHRRCVPEIIGFSNRIAYEPDGIRLIPVRQYGADRLEPIKTVFLADGYTRGSTSKVNPVEVDAVVNQIEKCIADPRYDGLTFGVISLLGSAQAKTIERELLDRVPPDEWTARDLRCGDSADFQGSERDVMFLSMVAASEPGKRMGALTSDVYVQRYNVAASRAKDQMWLFHSVARADLGNPEDMRFQLIDYCHGVINRSHQDDTGSVTHTVPDDRRVEPFDSLFEQRVFNRLYDRGYTVFPQYPVQSYRIDLVVIGAKSRLAIECDGDAWHGPDAYERDLARQRDLERCGWQFFRIRESAFYVDQPGVLEDLWATLRELDIHPSGSMFEEINEPTPVAEAPPNEHTQPNLATTAEADTTTSAATTEDDHRPVPVALVAPPDDRDMTREGHTADEAADEHSPGTGHTEPAVSVAAAHLVSDGDASLASYEEFTGTVPAAQEATRQQLIDGLSAIVAVEGPVMGHRMHSAYVKASGGQRVGKQIAKALNSAITTAVRRGLLIEDNPLGEPGVKPRTYRLLNQPTVRVRNLGPRTLEQVPPLELASLLSSVAQRCGWDSEETLYRETLDTLGLKRLTTNVTGRLEAVRALARKGQTR